MDQESVDLALERWQDIYFENFAIFEHTKKAITVIAKVNKSTVC